MKVRKPLMNPERVSNDGQPGNEFAASPALGRANPAAQGAHFIPQFVRRRPIRAVLLAAAVFAIPFSLARHHAPGNAQHAQPPAAAVLPSVLAPIAGPVAIVPDSAASGTTAWNPPIGLDRTNEALDRLTLDLSSGSQTHERSARFQAKDKAAKGHQDIAANNAVKAPKEKADSQVASKQVASGNAASGNDASGQVVASLPQPAAPQPAPAPQQPSEIAAAPPPAGAPVAAPKNDVQADDPARIPANPRLSDARPGQDVDQYLWNVYQRSTRKRDSSGDFTWKDEAAAARMGLVTRQYVIGGMDPDFKELLYNMGHAMDQAGVNWTILSGFRDDYRQGLASGYKARVGNSFHGGSRATGGYGHGCAADIEAAAGDDSAVWKFVDQHGDKFGIFRPMKGIDPAHIQPFGGWHDVAYNLRDKRDPVVQGGYLTASITGDGGRVTRLVDNRSGVSESQYDCVRSHRGSFHSASFTHRSRIGMGGRVHRAMFPPGRAHRLGRRRMVVDASGQGRRSAKETAQVSDLVKRAAAEASDKNRRDAKRLKSADNNNGKKRTAADAKRQAKERQAKAKNGVRIADEPNNSNKKL